MNILAKDEYTPGKFLISYSLDQDDFYDQSEHVNERMYSWAKDRVFIANTHCCMCTRLIASSSVKAINLDRANGQWCKDCLVDLARYS